MRDNNYFPKNNIEDPLKTTREERAKNTRCIILIFQVFYIAEGQVS